MGILFDGKESKIVHSTDYAKRIILKGNVRFNRATKTKKTK